MSAVAGARGRPPTLKKAEIPMDDGTELVMRLVGDGKTVQIVLPAQWNLSGMSRSITPHGGRTTLTFVSSD